MNRTLFQINEEILGLNALLDEVEGDDEQQKSILENYATTLQDDLERKLDNICAFASELDARALARKQEAERLLQRSKVDSNKSARLKEMLKWFFASHEMKNFETTRYRITLAINGGKLPLLVDPDQLLEEFLNQVITYVPDTDRIRGLLEAGQEVPGAMLGERGCSIRIK